MKKIVACGIVLLLLLSACSFVKSTPGTTDIQTAIAQTAEIQNAISTYIAQTQMAVQPPVSPTATATMEIPPTEAPPVAAAPTETPTVQAISSVQATANKNANCRSGPGANFDQLGTLTSGGMADVIGQNKSSAQWWKIVLADGIECWVIDDAVSLSGDTGLVAKLDSPPTPTAVPPPSWAYSWTTWLEGGFTPGQASASPGINMTQSGNQINLSFVAWEISFHGYGTVSADGMTVNGTLLSDYGHWSFYLVRNTSDLDQFRGKWFVPGESAWDGAFCGYKNGAGYPSPMRP